MRTFDLKRIFSRYASLLEEEGQVQEDQYPSSQRQRRLKAEMGGCMATHEGRSRGSG